MFLSEIFFPNICTRVLVSYQIIIQKILYKINTTKQPYLWQYLHEVQQRDIDVDCTYGKHHLQLCSSEIH